MLWVSNYNKIYLPEIQNVDISKYGAYINSFRNSCVVFGVFLTCFKIVENYSYANKNQ